MRAHLAELAVMEHDDAVAFLDRRQPVRDDERRPPFKHALDRSLNELLGLGVDRAGRFVENEDRRIERQRRANEINCFCPTDNPAPRSLTSDIIRAVDLLYEFVRMYFAGGPLDAITSDFLIPSRMLFSIEPLKRKTSCRTNRRKFDRRSCRSQSRRPRRQAGCGPFARRRIASADL
jgi:hypothetical protein